MPHPNAVLERLDGGHGTISFSANTTTEQDSAVGVMYFRRALLFNACTVYSTLSARRKRVRGVFTRWSILAQTDKSEGTSHAWYTVDE